MKLFLKNSNLYDHNSPTSQTDGRTDGRTDRRHAIAIPRFAQSASRGKNGPRCRISFFLIPDEMRKRTNGTYTDKIVYTTRDATCMHYNMVTMWFNKRSIMVKPRLLKRYCICLNGVGLLLWNRLIEGYTWLSLNLAIIEISKLFWGYVHTITRILDVLEVLRTTYFTFIQSNILINSVLHFYGVTRVFLTHAKRWDMYNVLAQCACNLNFILTRGWASECPDVKNYKWRFNPV